MDRKNIIYLDKNLSLTTFIRQLPQHTQRIIYLVILNTELQHGYNTEEAAKLADLVMDGRLTDLVDDITIVQNLRASH